MNTSYLESLGLSVPVEHFSADEYAIAVGAQFWDNNLLVVRVTAVAVDANPYPYDATSTPQGIKGSDGNWYVVQTWHQTTGGRFDTCSVANPFLGRLVRRYEGISARDYAPGTTHEAARLDKAPLVRR